MHSRSKKFGVDSELLSFTTRPSTTSATTGTINGFPSSVAESTTRASSDVTSGRSLVTCRYTLSTVRQGLAVWTSTENLVLGSVTRPLRTSRLISPNAPLVDAMVRLLRVRRTTCGWMRKHIQQGSIGIGSEMALRE